MGVYLKGITEDIFKDISCESVYLALKRLDSIVEVKEPHGRLIDAERLKEEGGYIDEQGWISIDEAPTVIEKEG